MRLSYLVVFPLAWTLLGSDQHDDEHKGIFCSSTLVLRLFFFPPACADDSQSCFMRALSFLFSAPAP